MRGWTFNLLAGITAVTLALSACADPGGDTKPADRPARPRVDRATPTFSDPTRITNPLFPITTATQVLQLGREGDVALRHEVTLLPETRTIRWNGQEVEVVVSQFVAYGDGRILETAVDFFAQADDGSVWYFGEDVFNYENGVVANTDGTWLAGRDGPPGMIMPATPRVGDVYRPENIPNLVFEEVTVQSIGETVPGPRGPVAGAIVVEEALQDGTREGKVFAPGYGEFRARVKSSDELVTVALAVPIDAVSGPVPVSLTTISDAAARVFDAARAEDWPAATSAGRAVRDAWNARPSRRVPPLLATRLTDTIAALSRAIDARDDAGTRQAALDVGIAALDAQLRYREQAEIDLARLELVADQMSLDREIGDAGAVAGDVAVLEAIHKRVAEVARAGA